MPAEKEHPEPRETLLDAECSFDELCLKAEKIALNLIARAEQNSFGLKMKLKRKKIDSSVVNTVVKGLLDRGLLDDSRFAVLWLRSRLAQGRDRSPNRMLVSLAQRGIGRDISLKALKKVLDEETEYNLLLKYIEKACFSETLKACPPRPEITRIVLKNEGFSSEMIDQYFDQYFDSS